MEQFPLVTIGLPFYNNFRTLELAIKSVLFQSYNNWELIIINDGSTDESSIIVDYYKKLDSRIYFIDDKLNKGLVYRLNQIINIANGEFIARFDADDIMMPTRIEKQIQYLLDHPNIDIVSTSIYTIDENNIPTGKRDNTPILKTFDNIINKTFLTHPTILGRILWFKKYKYSSFHRAEDLDLWIRSFENSNYYRIQEPLYLYREGNVNIRNYINTAKTFKRIIKLYAPKYYNRFKILNIVIITDIKTLLYIFLGFLKIQYILTKKRNKSLTSNEILIIENQISIIKLLNFEKN